MRVDGAEHIGTIKELPHQANPDARLLAGGEPHRRRRGNRQSMDIDT